MGLTNVQLWPQFPKLATERGEVIHQANVSGWSSPQHPPPADQGLGPGP
jgi:hypothetical protein